jgi:hypothetical protein
MTPKPSLLCLVAALLVAVPALAAPTHTGTWTASLQENQLQLSLRMKGEPGSQMGMSEPLTAFQGLSTAEGSTAPFKMTREAGTFTFEGRFSGGEGAGHYQFEPSPGYTQAMAGLGYPKLTPEDQFKLALFDIGTPRVKALAALGYKDIPLENLFEVGIFEVTPEYIQALGALGYTKLSLKDLVKLRIHGIDREFVRSVSGGKGKDDARKKP